MVDYTKIAKQYADERGWDIVQPSAKRNGYMYFNIDYTGRPRYTGHPHIIKISRSGEVKRVIDFNEIYWAFNHRTITNGQSV